MKELIIEASSIECSEERREISGKIVPMGTGEVGSTNMGGVVFAANSIDVTDISKIKLLSQHDMKKPVGRMTAAEVRPDGIYATFKLSRSTGGNDALIQAQEGLVSGLSVGAEVISSQPSRDGHIVVTAAKLKEVSLVTEPAFKSAQVLEIAAEEVIPAEETQPESEPQVEESTTAVEAPAVEAAAVEAARPTVVANLQVKERTAPITSAQYLEASIKAAMGDDNARRTVLAADDTTSTNTGLTLPQHLNEFVTTTFTGRPAFEAVTRQALPSTGMSFTIPKITTAPTIDSDSTEGEALAGTEMASGYITPTVKKAAGLQNISWELLDRSGPSFYAELIKELQYAYAKATDQAVVAALVAGGTQASTQAATIAGFKAYIGKETPAAYLAAGKFAKNIIANTAWWETIITAEDTTNRPLFTAAQPANSPGNVGMQSLTGTVMGQNLFVDPHMTTTTLIDDSAFLVVPEAVTFYESPQTQIQVQALANGRLQVAVYGYYAIAPKVGGGVRRFNLT